MQRLYTSETWSLRVKFDFMITHKCHLQKTPGNYQRKKTVVIKLSITTKSQASP